MRNNCHVHFEYHNLYLVLPNCCRPLGVRNMRTLPEQSLMNSMMPTLGLRRVALSHCTDSYDTPWQNSSTCNKT